MGKAIGEDLDEDRPDYRGICRNLGPEEAFRVLVKRMRPRLRAWGMQWTCNWHQAEDWIALAEIAMHETFVVHEGWKQINSPESFLAGVFRNKRRDNPEHGLGHAVIHSLSTKDGNWDLPDKGKPEPDERIEPMLAAMKRLPAMYQEVLNLKYLLGLSLREISEILEVPPSTVVDRLWKARELLREMFGGQGGVTPCPTYA